MLTPPGFTGVTHTHTMRITEATTPFGFTPEATLTNAYTTRYYGGSSHIETAQPIGFTVEAL